jgi:hypothetical protein
MKLNNNGRKWKTKSMKTNSKQINNNKKSIKFD